MINRRTKQDLDYSNISKRIILVRYDRTSDATKEFSQNCDVRIIWGGDETISQIRENSLQPRAFDITFADRYSLCVINGDEFVNEPRPEKVVEGFFNDTFLFDQNACTSPHLIVWLGSDVNVKKSQNIFWDLVYKIVKEKYQVQPVLAVDKITSFFRQAIQMKTIHKTSNKDNLLWRVNLEELCEDIDMYKSSSGYFSEYHAGSLTELSRIINRKYQTLAYYGFSKRDFSNLIDEIRPLGIDRIVPIGRTMDFSLIWDGYNIIDSLSRNIEIL